VEHLRELLRRIRCALAAGRRDDELREEMAFHRDMKQRELERAGLDARQAAIEAHREFGSSALAADQARDVWLWPWLQDVARDIRFAFRLLMKDRAFTGLAAVVLGLGIGVTNMQAVLVNAICVRGLPMPRVDRVAYLAARDARDREQPLAFREFDVIGSSTPALSETAAFASARAVVGEDGLAPDRALVAYVSSTLFRIAGETPSLGRAFVPADDRPGAPPTAILARAFWLSRYAGDPSIVGRTARIDGVPTTIVGVMGDGFRFPSTTDLWMPLGQMAGITTAKRATRTLGAIGRLVDGRTFADLRGQLTAETREFAHAYPDTDAELRLTAVPINDRYNGRLTDSVWIAFMSVGVIVLLIACANAANLLLMRSAGRGHEMAVRASLGASRSRLVRQLLIESAALASIGGLVGVVLSLASIRAIERLTPRNTLAYWITFTMDARLFGLLCAICLGTVFVFGLAPALHVSRADIGAIMKEGSRGGTASVRVRRWTTGFLTTEFGLTMVMIAALVLGWRQTMAAARTDMVVDPDRVVTGALTLSSARYGSADERQLFYDALSERVAAIPDAASFAMATALPSGGAAPRQTDIEGRADAGASPPPTSWAVSIAGDYFDVLGLRLLSGRSFDDRDGRAGSAAAIVNARFAQMFFPGADAIGRRVKLSDPNGPPSTTWLTIVGVAPTVRQRPLPDPDPVVYLPMRSAPPATAVLLVRARSDSAQVGPLLRKAVGAIDSNMPIDRLMSMADALALAQWNGRLSTDLLNGIGLVALVLAAIGVYAVASYGVSQRTQEIGVRMALGAQGWQVVRIVVRRQAGQLLWGLAAGFVCILGWQRLVGGGSSERYLSPGGLSDPIDLIAVAAVMTMIVAIASVVPARRAAKLDPLVALRHE
jgi:putative ABC transport system permease protein